MQVLLLLGHLMFHGNYTRIGCSYPARSAGVRDRHRLRDNRLHGDAAGAFRSPPALALLRRSHAAALPPKETETEDVDQEHDHHSPGHLQKLRARVPSDADVRADEVDECLRALGNAVSDGTGEKEDEESRESAQSRNERELAVEGHGDRDQVRDEGHGGEDDADPVEYHDNLQLVDCGVLLAGSDDLLQLRSRWRRHCLSDVGSVLVAVVALAAAHDMDAVPFAQIETVHDIVIGGVNHVDKVRLGRLKRTGGGTRSRGLDGSGLRLDGRAGRVRDTRCSSLRAVSGTAYRRGEANHRVVAARNAGSRCKSDHRRQRSIVEVDAWGGNDIANITLQLDRHDLAVKLLQDALTNATGV